MNKTSFFEASLCHVFGVPSGSDIYFDMLSVAPLVSILGSVFSKYSISEDENIMSEINQAFNQSNRLKFKCLIIFFRFIYVLCLSG
jgi:hypothetical protein